MSARQHIKVTYSTLGSPDPLLHEYYEEALQRARAALGQPHQLYIDGAWSDAASTYTTHSPIDTSVVIGTFQDGTAAHIDRAVGAARAAYPAWRATPWQERVALLRKVAEIISKRLFDIAAVDSLEVGKNRLEADQIEAGVIYVNRHTSATTGAWPGYQPFGGWKGSSSTGRGAGGAYYLQQYLLAQSQTMVRHGQGWDEEDEWRAEASE